MRAYHTIYPHTPRLDWQGLAVEPIESRTNTAATRWRVGEPLPYRTSLRATYTVALDDGLFVSGSTNAAAMRDPDAVTPT